MKHPPHDLAKIEGAFTADHVVQLTGLSKRQLAYWDRTGFFAPTYAHEARRSPHSRIYSFADVVGLRTLAVLRHQYGIGLAHLREVGARLSARSEKPWSELQLSVLNRRVYFDDPVTGETQDALNGQLVLLPIIDVVRDVRAGVAHLKTREPEEIGAFRQHRHVLGRRPVIAGTRIPVETVGRYIEDGFSPEQILAEYPSLTRADIDAVAQTMQPPAA